MAQFTYKSSLSVQKQKKSLERDLTYNFLTCKREFLINMIRESKRKKQHPGNRSKYCPSMKHELLDEVVTKRHCGIIKRAPLNTIIGYPS